VSSASPALIAAAAGVGIGHAILPDHWVPLAVLGRTRRYPLARVAKLSGLAGVAHVAVSLLLGAVIIAIGLQLRSTVQSAQDTIVGGLLLATGIAFAALELAGRGHGRSHEHARSDEHGHNHDHDDHVNSPRRRGLAGFMVSFGAAASPDLTILPVFLAATTAGTATAIGSLLAFAAVTIATIVGLTLLATLGGYQLRGRWLDRWGNAVTAATLIVIGALVLAGVI
jgi:nickel/cobalt transporter (NicO) family protein